MVGMITVTHYWPLAPVSKNSWHVSWLSWTTGDSCGLPDKCLLIGCFPKYWHGGSFAWLTADKRNLFYNSGIGSSHSLLLQHVIRDLAALLFLSLDHVFMKLWNSFDMHYRVSSCHLFPAICYCISWFDTMVNKCSQGSHSQRNEQLAAADFAHVQPGVVRLVHLFLGRWDLKWRPCLHLFQVNCAASTSYVLYSGLVKYASEILICSFDCIFVIWLWHVVRLLSVELSMWFRCQFFCLCAAIICNLWQRSQWNCWTSWVASCSYIVWYSHLHNFSICICVV